MKTIACTCGHTTNVSDDTFASKCAACGRVTHVPYVVSPYYRAYMNGYLTAECEMETSAPATGDGFMAPVPGTNEDAFRAAQRWGHSDAYNGVEPRGEACVVMHLDNDFAI